MEKCHDVPNFVPFVVETGGRLSAGTKRCIGHTLKQRLEADDCTSHAWIYTLCRNNTKMMGKHQQELSANADWRPTC